MKRLFIAIFACLAAGQVLAADLPVPAPHAPAAFVPPLGPSYNWTGVYIGGNVGAAWNQGSVTDNNGLTFGNNSNKPAVFTGGGQVGGNWQIGVLVLGVEGQFDWLANQNNSNAGAVVHSLGVQVDSNYTRLMTFTGRVGYAADRWLFYAKGGGAWVANQSFTVNDLTTGASFTSSDSGGNSGWTVGAGFEWAFAGDYSVRAEYDFVRLANKSFTVPAGNESLVAGDTFTTSNRDIQMALVGLNYKFGPW